MNLIIYIVAFLEGFTTLAVEVLAIRKAVPLIGNNVVITSIILGVIILALSLGYYVGGIFSQKKDKKILSEILRNNLIISAIYYTFLSFMFENILIEYLIKLFDNYILAVFLMSLILFFIPVFLASQSVPLLTQLHDDDLKGLTAGKILFYSTIGSFLGSVVPVLVLLPNIGLLKSVYVIGFLLIICAILVQIFFLNKKNFYLNIFLILIFSALFVGQNSGGVYSYDSIYQNIKIYEDGNYRIMSLDGSLSSAIDTISGNSPFNYIKKSVELTKNSNPRSILVLGAAGFTYPEMVAAFSGVEILDVVDIDGVLYDLAQDKFYQKKLNEKINFIPQSGRYYINECLRKGKKYDLVFVDVYSSKMNIPSDFLTKEYFESLSKIGDILISNIILDPGFEKVFSKNLINTIHKTGTQKYYQNVSLSSGEYANFLFSNIQFSGFSMINSFENYSMYTDDLNNIEADKYDFFY